MVNVLHDLICQNPRVRGSIVKVYTHVYIYIYIHIYVYTYVCIPTDYKKHMYEQPLCIRSLFLLLRSKESRLNECKGFREQMSVASQPPSLNIRDGHPPWSALMTHASSIQPAQPMSVLLGSLGRASGSRLRVPRSLPKRAWAP